jgi:predicted RNA-binding protein with PIN domain
MSLLIDGYNLMWAMDALNPVARMNFDMALQLLMKLLTAYAARTAPGEVVLVLDGYRGASPYTRYQEEGGMQVVITGRGITADRWMMDAMSRQGFEGTAVTGDGEILKFARSRGVPCITSKKFESLLMEEARHDKALMDEMHSRKRQFRKLQKGSRG